jgi:3-oxoacyl-[acyl-carrier protein] reductase
MRLSEKVVLVTGAGRGIGRAIALKFSDEGAKVVVNDINIAPAESIVERLKKMGRKALPVGADVSKREEVEGMFERAIREFGRLDILINNAGIRRDILIHRMSEDEWDAVLNVNLKGSFNCAQAAQKYMVKQNYGKIVHISSPVPATLVDRGQAHYASASAGLQGLTKALALELGRYNINVNCIVPDFIDSEMTRDSARRIGLYLEDLKKAAAAQIALRRLGTAEDVANVALFLASDESSFISGQIIQVKGGP